MPRPDSDPRPIDVPHVPSPTFGAPQHAPVCRNVPERAGLCRHDPLSSAARAGAHNAARCSQRQLAAIRLLAQGAGSVRIARELGVNRHTVARWKREPAFAAELVKLQRQMRAVVVAPAVTGAAERARPDPLEQWVAQELGARADDVTPARRPAPPRENAPKDDARDEFDDNFDFEAAEEEDDADDDMSDEEAKAIEEWVDSVIVAGATGKPIPRFPRFAPRPPAPPTPPTPPPG